MSGEVNKYIRDGATNFTRNFLNSLFNLPKPTTTDSVVITFTNQEHTKGVLNNGEEVTVVPLGNSTANSELGYKISDGIYCTYRKSVKTIFAETNAQHKGYILTAGYLPNTSFLVPNPPFTSFLVASAWPIFTVFDIKNSSNYFEIPQDPTFLVFQSFTNSDIPTHSNGHDGRFWARFGPGMSSLALIRINYTTEDVLPIGTTPTTTVDWTVLNGLGFDKVHNVVTWTSVTNGTTTVPYIGPVGNIQYQYLAPEMWWDVAGSFHFDVIGNWSSTPAVGSPTTGNFYGIQVDTGGGLVNLTAITLFTHDSGTAKQKFYTEANKRQPGHGDPTTGNDSPAFHNASEITQTAIIGFSVAGPNALQWCAPYGSAGTNLANGDPCIFDTTRIYPNDPLWSDITEPEGASINSPHLKTVSTGSFVAERPTLGLFIGPGTLQNITFRMTNYSWNTPLNQAVAHTDITGGNLIYGSSTAGGWVDHGKVGNMIDWLIK